MRCSLSTSPQTSASNPPELHVCHVKANEIYCRGPLAGEKDVFHTPSSSTHTHTPRRPRLSCPTRPPLHFTAHSLTYIFCRAYCLCIAFLTRDATLKTFLKYAITYGTFVKCFHTSSFFLKTVTFRSAFCSIR